MKTIVCNYCGKEAEKEDTHGEPLYCGSSCKRAANRVRHPRIVNEEEHNPHYEMSVCPNPWKKLFLTLEDAQKFADEHSQRAYQCLPGCSYFHVASYKWKKE